MKKIVVFSGSPRKNGHTVQIVKKIEADMSDSVFEYVYLYDYEIHGCVGCKACIRKDEIACPYKDDVHDLLVKLENADGIILISPTYSRVVSGQLKNFIDRTNFALHRPRLINIPMVTLATTDIGMAKNVANYLSVIGSSLGANVIGSLAVKMGKYYNDETYKLKIDNRANQISKRFEIALKSNEDITPTLRQLMRFNVWKTRAIVSKEMYPNDYKYWEERNWIEKDFFTAASIPAHRKFIMTLLSKRLRKVIRTGVVYKD